MKARFPRAARLGLLASALFLAGACASGSRTVPISTLHEDPGRYDGRTVRVQGRVTETLGAIGYGSYRINDGTGDLRIVSTGTGVPSEGARVGVEGTFRAIYTIGPTSGTALLERRRFRP